MKHSLILSLSRPLVFAAAFAAFTLLFVLAMLPSTYFLNLEFLGPISVLGSWWFTLLASFIVVATGLSGLTVARFALRLVPIRFEERVRARAFVLGLSTLVLLALFALFAVFSPIVDDRRDARLGLWFVGAAPDEVRIAGAAAVIVFAVCSVVPFLWRHARPGAFLNQRFILYLRRFSTFSDRSVMNEVLRACPHGRPVVFLIPTRSAIRDWNPFQIGIAGLRILSPIRSLPIPVRTEDASWQSAARKLIEAAETIVLDASEGSASILAETQLIDSMHLWHKTVVLRIGEDKPVDSTGNGLLAERSAELIHYKRNWRRALPRLILGPVASIFPAMWLGIFLLLLTSIVLLPLRAFGVDVGMEQFSSDPKTVLALVAILTAWIYFVLFWRPAINKEAAVALAKRLRKTPQSDTA